MDCSCDEHVGKPQTDVLSMPCCLFWMPVSLRIMQSLLAQTKLCKKMIKFDLVNLRIRGFDDFMHQRESNPPGSSKRSTPQLLHARGLELLVYVIVCVSLAVSCVRVDVPEFPRYCYCFF